MQNVPRLVVAAVRGGLGKTTLPLGITVVWRSRGRKVAPFKKGPDFIDAGWVGAAAGSACYNLDLFLMEEESIRRSFVQHTAGCDAIGRMGWAADDSRRSAGRRTCPGTQDDGCHPGRAVSGLSDLWLSSCNCSPTTRA